MAAPHYPSDHFFSEKLIRGFLPLIYEAQLLRLQPEVQQWPRITRDRVPTDGRAGIGAGAPIRDQRRKSDYEEKGGQPGIGDPVWIDGRTLRAALSAITAIDIEALA
jgi:hypothetical protein